MKKQIKPITYVRDVQNVFIYNESKHGNPMYMHDVDSGCDIHAVINNSTKDITIQPIYKQRTFLEILKGIFKLQSENTQDECVSIHTGIYINIPDGYEINIRPRSGLFKKGLLTNGTIDCGYNGEIIIMCWNLSNKPIVIEDGMRIAQMVFSPTSKMQFSNVNDYQTFKSTFKDDVDDIDSNTKKRGDGGFGHTGLK